MSKLTPDLLTKAPKRDDWNFGIGLPCEINAGREARWGAELLLLCSTGLSRHDHCKDDSETALLQPPAPPSVGSQVGWPMGLIEAGQLVYHAPFLISALRS